MTERGHRGSLVIGWRHGPVVRYDRQMRNTLAVLLFACSTSSTQPDAGPPVLTSEDIVCETHTQTTIASDGSKTVSDVRFALVDVAPTDDYWIEYCDYTNTASDSGVTRLYVPTDPACPPGATCTNTGAALPTPTSACAWQHQNGTFLDGKLQILCGTDYRQYTTDGIVAFASSYTYSAIRLHR